MENNDPIFDKFRKNAQRIEEAPSSDAWTKLSSRLDKHERTPVRRRMLPGLGIMSIAASVLLLVGLVFVISQTVLKPRQSETFAERRAVPRQVEDLPLLASTESISSPQMAEYQRKINANPRGIIKEGGDHKKLVAQPLRVKQTIGNENHDNTNINLGMMNNFDWILGTWKSTTAEGVSTEIWTSVSPNLFSGTGKFVDAENNAVFTEEMTLRKVQEKIYFEATTQSAGAKVSYELVNINDNKSIFKNLNIDFPTHVFILRNANGGFSISYQNIPPVAVPENSFLLKNRHNSVKAKEIKRELDRKI